MDISNFVPGEPIDPDGKVLREVMAIQTRQAERVSDTPKLSVYTDAITAGATPMDAITWWVGRLPEGSLVCAWGELAGVVQSVIDASGRADVELRVHPWMPADEVAALTSFASLRVAAGHSELYDDADEILMPL